MNLLGWSRSAFAATLFAAASIGCSDPGPDPVGPSVESVYAAATVGGNALPVSSGVGSGHEITLIADTLEFLSNGDVRKITILRIIGAGSDGSAPQRFSSTWMYSIVGRRVTIGPHPCPPNALCVGPIEGDIDEDRVVLPYSMNLGSNAGELVLSRVN